MATVDDYILYLDHANHLTPLTLTYHATASRHLTSGRSDIIPPSTVVEVDSAYCPRSLTFCDVASAQANALLYGGGEGDAGGGLCKDCPICFSPVSISIDKNTHTTTTAATAAMTTTNDCEQLQLVCHYLCGHCKWSSRECGIVANADKLLDYSTTSDDDDNVDATIKESEIEKQRQLAIADISKELVNCLQQRIADKNKVSDAIFNSIITIWAEREQDEQRRKRMNIGTTGWGNATAVDRDSEEGWSREILEQSLLDKKKNMETLYISRKAEYNTSSEEDMQIINWDNVVGNPKNLPTQQQSAAQMTITNITPQSRSDLLPLPVYYRAKVSRRCRAELSAGRTGILVKPKLNPLEGDTSLRAGHGQWWKKDSSAIHVVPRVRVIRQGSRRIGDITCQTTLYAVLLSVKNPTLNMIRLRLASTTTGPSSTISAPSVSIDQRELENILVNPFTETFVQGHLCPTDAMSSIAPTDYFVLDPANDPFLDIGNKSSHEEGGDPLVVKNWDAMTTLGTIAGDGGSGTSSKSKLLLVATKGDTAWVELILCIDDATSPPPTAINDTNTNADYLTVPLALQIEIGNGSWEASLIKRRHDTPNEEMDLVTFHLVALLR